MKNFLIFLVIVFCCSTVLLSCSKRTRVYGTPENQIVYRVDSNDSEGKPNPPYYEMYDPETQYFFEATKIDDEHFEYTPQSKKRINDSIERKKKQESKGGDGH